MIPIKINIDSTKEYSLPQSWDEVKTYQFIRLSTIQGEPKLSEIIAILADINLDEVRNSSDLKLDERLWPLLSWYAKAPDWQNLKKPEYVQIDGKCLSIPSDLGYSTFEQVENLKMLFTQELDRQKDSKSFDFTNMIIPAVAEYLQPMFDGSNYDADRAKQFETVVESLPITTTYPLASFFFKTYLGFKSLSRHDYKGKRMRIILMLKKLTLDLWKNLDYLEQSITYQRAMPQNLVKSSRQSGTLSSTTGHTPSGNGNMKSD